MIIVNLNEEEKQRIESQETPIEIMTEAWRIVFSHYGEEWDNFSEENSVDPTQYKMTPESWQWVCQVIIDKSRELNIEPTSQTFQWINIGPSTI